jgi:pimeloyl-ACP methyl ester carboxylesterase
MDVHRPAALVLTCLSGLLSAPASATAPVPAGLPTRHLDVPGGRIAWDDTGGGGLLLIAIPGMGDLRGEYRHLRPVLEAAGHRVVTMDVRGHGESSPAWDDYSARAVGRDALALVDHVGAGPAVILGNSFAAGAALWAAHESPDSVAGAVLLGPILRDLPQPWFVDAAVKVGFAGPWRVWFWTTYWNSLFKAYRPVDHEPYRAALVDNLREPGRMDALRRMVSLSKADTEAILDDTRVPALVVMGSADPDFEDASGEARDLAQRLGAESLVVDGVGHYPHAERPDVVGARIVEFLARLR